MGHLLIHNFPPLQLLLQLSIQPFHLHKCESIQSRVKRRVLLSRGAVFLGFFPLACMDFPRSHFPSRQPTGRWKEDEEVGEMIDNFSFAHRSIFALDRSLGRKDVGHARTCFLFLPRCHFHACLFLHYTHVVQFSLAYFFLADLPLRPPLLTWRDSESPWLPFLSLQMSAAAGSMATLWTLPTYFLGNP